MDNSNFKRAVNIILKMEGGYVNDPIDPGGETKFGISKRAYPNVDIKNLTKAEAKEIYKRDYWDALRCDELPPIIRLIAFDCGVNQGTYFATKAIQELVRATTDGKMGPKTIEAVNASNSERLFEKFSYARLKRYHGTRTFYRFGLGWIRRLTHIIIMSK